MLKAVAGAAIAIAVLASPALAAMECGSMLDKSADAILKMSNASPEKRAALRRMALHGYDNCMAGDEFNAMKFFEMIEKARK
jgi:hypothetical protein